MSGHRKDVSKKGVLILMRAWHRAVLEAQSRGPFTDGRAAGTPNVILFASAHSATKRTCAPLSPLHFPRKAVFVPTFASVVRTPREVATSSAPLLVV